MTWLLRPQATTILLKVYPKKPTPCLSQILGCKQLNQTLGNLRRPGRDWTASVEFPMPGRGVLTPLSSPDPPPLLCSHNELQVDLQLSCVGSFLGFKDLLGNMSCYQGLKRVKRFPFSSLFQGLPLHLLRTPPRRNQTRAPAFHNTPPQSNLEPLSKTNILSYLKIWLHDSPAPSK